MNKIPFLCDPSPDFREHIRACMWLEVGKKKKGKTFSMENLIILSKYVMLSLFCLISEMDFLVHDGKKKAESTADVVFAFET